MTEQEIKEGFKFLGLEELKDRPYKGVQQYTESFEIASVLKDVAISMCSSLNNCSRQNK